METAFTKEFFIGNRASLRQTLATDDLIVVTANGLLQRNADNSFTFRQDSSFWYFTGLSLPDLVLVMAVDGEYLMVPGRDAVREAFDGAIDPQQLAVQSGVETILDDVTGWKRLAGQLKRTKQVATLSAAPGYIEQIGLYANPARQRLVERLQDNNKSIEVIDIRDQVSAMRSVKQPLELAALQQAIDITIAGVAHVTAKDKLASYGYEYEVEADMLHLFKKQKAAGHAFDPIVVAGRRACTMHNFSMDGSLDTSELLLLDVGAEVSNYAADIARTVAIGQPSGRQLAVHAAVSDVQDYAMRLLKPGVLLMEYEKGVATYMGEKLLELGLIKTASEEGIRQYYPHATSHFLGLDVHDAGLYRQPLTAGMVLTCEPGIYIPDESIGVRIEDDILITKARIRRAIVFIVGG